MDNVNSVFKSAKSFFFGTAFSRITGFGRDIAIAMSFGSSSEIAAFMVAYRLANLFRRLLGEGNLQAGFVPHFSSLKDEGGRFFRDVTFSLAFILLIAIALLESILWGISGFVSSDWKMIINLTIWMVPGLFFVSLYGLNSSLLQCRKKYFIPAAAPVVFNLIWIGAVLIYPNVSFLAIAITLAFAGQWFVTAFEGIRLLSLKEWLRPQLFSQEFRKLIKPLVLGIIGISAVQFNSALDPIFARVADLKGPAFLWYAIRLQQLPLAFFGVALSGALLPPLSRAEDPVQKWELLGSSLKAGITFMLVFTFGILALGEMGVNLLFGHGDFTRADVLETTKCLWAYGIGLLPSVFVLILAAKFYAEKDYRTPTIASLFSVILNVFFNALFVFGFGWGAVSIAIATTLSSLVNALLLAKGVMELKLTGFILKMGVGGTAATAILWGIENVWPGPFDLLQQAMNVLLLGLLFLGIYWLVLLALKENLLKIATLKKANLS